MSISKEFVVSRLIDEFGYTPRGADLVATKLADSSSAVRQAFEQWWTTKELPSLAVEGYDVQRLMREHNMRPVAALLTLDWLMREPARAKASLARGHDRVEPFTTP